MEPARDAAQEKSPPSTGFFCRDYQDYEKLSLIGAGAYGTVFKARDTFNNGIVALKKVRVPFAEDGVPTSTLREISLLKNLDHYNHPNIVRLLDVCHGKRMEREKQLMIYLVFEHMEQDLGKFMQAVPPPGMPVDVIKNIMKQIINGVDFLHSHRIVHRDLKPQNILISADRRVKLADFGLAKTYDFDMRLTTVVVTLWYRAPEILLSQPYATSLDIWSIGCIMAEMYRKQPLFCGSSEADQLDKIFMVIGTPLEKEWPEKVSISWSSFVQRPKNPFKTLLPELCDAGVDLLTHMLLFNEKQRITAGAALKHSYFNEEFDFPNEKDNVNVSSGDSNSAQNS